MKISQGFELIFVQRRPDVFDVGHHCTNVIQIFCVYWDPPSLGRWPSIVPTLAERLVFAEDLHKGQQVDYATQCWCNDGPASQTLAHHYTNIDPASVWYSLMGAPDNYIIIYPPNL